MVGPRRGNVDYFDKIMCVRPLLLPWFLLLVLPPLLPAHPHVWIDAHGELHFDDDGLAKVEHRWIFDELFTESVLLDFDTNRNRRIEPRENREIEAGAFSNLQYYDYFTHLTVDGRELPVSEVQGFTATVENDRLVYRFEIPVDLDVRNSWRRLSFGVWDDTYFVEVSYESPAVAVYGHREHGIEIDIAMERNEQKAYWGGFIVPQEARLAFRRR